MKSFSSSGDQTYTTSRQSKSILRIEDKLLTYKIQTTKRLELLKQSLDQEKMKEVQSKPKILKKSRILAEMHEKKYFAPCEPIKEAPVIAYNSDKPPENIEKKEYPCIITVKSVPYSPHDKTPTKKRPRSVQSRSIIERSKVWLQAKKEKIGEKRMIRDKSDLAECTFSPSMLKKSPKRLERNAKEETLTPQSFETYADSTDQSKRIIKSLFIPKSLTPFQQRISFKSGIDIENFIKRAK